MTPNLRLRVAYHEAGHAVAALAAGYDVNDCRIYDDGHGLTRYETPGDRTWCERYRLLSVTVAGNVAEWLVFGWSLPATSDERRAGELLATFPDERAELRAEAEVRAESALRARPDQLRTIARDVHVTGAWRPDSFAVDFHSFRHRGRDCAPVVVGQPAHTRREI